MAPNTKCSAITVKGLQCSRSATNGLYCLQHSKMDSVSRANSVVAEPQDCSPSILGKLNPFRVSTPVPSEEVQTGNSQLAKESSEQFLAESEYVEAPVFHTGKATSLTVACKGMMKSGPRMGQVCGHNTTNVNGYCGKHQLYSKNGESNVGSISSKSIPTVTQLVAPAASKPIPIPKAGKASTTTQYMLPKHPSELFEVDPYMLECYSDKQNIVNADSSLDYYNLKSKIDKERTLINQAKLRIQSRENELHVLIRLLESTYISK